MVVDVRRGDPKTRLLQKIPPHEPNNFIVPFLSGRWGVKRLSNADKQSASAVYPDLRNLDAKVDKASTTQLKAIRDFYIEGCMKTLGYSPVPVPVEGGRGTAHTINERHNVALDRMGSGSRNIVALYALMADAKNKLFVIEEPENDIHPEALRKLLHDMVEASARNQFIITTHSHIVLNVLGAESDTKIWYVDIDFPDRVPTSSVEEVGDDKDDRLRVLRQLGNEFSDMSLWDGWLVLEESSAERIIREFLIPWFAPGLCRRLGTCSAGSLSKVERRFEALNDLFLFLHLTHPYKNRAWVVVDAGDDEQKIINDLQMRYKPSGWKEEQFRQWSKHDFEDYYPARFGDEWSRIRGIAADKEKMDAKKALLHKVLDWICEEKEQAKTEFAESAADVITVLNEISDALCGDAGETSS